MATRFIYAHFLADGRILLKQKVDVEVHFANVDAPSHAADDFVEFAEAFDFRPVVASADEQVDYLEIFDFLQFIFSTFGLKFREINIKYMIDIDF